MSDIANPSAAAGMDPAGGAADPNAAAAVADPPSTPADPGVETVGRLQLTEANATALAPKGFKSADDLAAAYLSLEKKIGEKGLTVPGEDASDEERNAFFNQLGRPETADGYDVSALKLPDGIGVSDDRQKAALQGLHKLGLTQQQAMGVLELHSADLQSALQEVGFVVENSDELIADFDKNHPAGSQKRKEAMADLQRGYSMLGLSEIGDVDQISKRVGSAKLMEVAMKIGRLSTEDGQLVPGNSATASPASARAEIKEMESNPEKRKILMDPAHPEHASLIDRRNRLYGLANSEGNV